MLGELWKFFMTNPESGCYMLTFIRADWNVFKIGSHFRHGPHLYSDAGCFADGDWRRNAPGVDSPCVFGRARLTRHHVFCQVIILSMYCWSITYALFLSLHMFGSCRVLLHLHGTWGISCPGLKTHPALWQYIVFSIYLEMTATTLRCAPKFVVMWHALACHK
jgi:hypothetical protein